MENLRASTKSFMPRQLEEQGLRNTSVLPSNVETISVPKRHHTAVRVHPTHVGRQPELPGVTPLAEPEHRGRCFDRPASSGRAEVASDVGSVGSVRRSAEVQLWRLRPVAWRRVLLHAESQFPEEPVTAGARTDQLTVEPHRLLRHVALHSNTTRSRKSDT